MLELQPITTKEWIAKDENKVLGGGRCTTCHLDGVTIYDPEQIEQAQVLKSYHVTKGHSYSEFPLAG